MYYSSGFYLPAPNGTFDEIDLVFGLVSVFSSSLLLSTAIWFPADAVLTIFGVAVVSVQVVVPVVCVLRNKSICNGKYFQIDLRIGIKDNKNERSS